MISMAALTRGLTARCQISPMLTQEIHTTCVVERARKGTRVRKRKQVLQAIKKKAERLRKNPPPIPYKVELMLKRKGLWGPPKPHREVDTDLPFAADSVYFAKDFAYKRHTIQEAVENLRQICHPSMYNDPDCLVSARIELDLKAAKKDRFMDEFTKTVPILKPYERNMPDRRVICFVPNDEMRIAALQEGAVMAGGQELIVEVAKGRVDIADIDHFLCHEDLAGSIKPLHGAIRDKAPSLANGTLGTDVIRMIQTFAKGLQINVKKPKTGLGLADEPDFGFCESTIGRLTMPPEDMNHNLSAILAALNEHKPRRKDGTGFITRVMLYCLPNQAAEVNKFFRFSIKHAEIYDPKAEEQEEALAKGRKEIMENVKKLKEGQ